MFSSSMCLSLWSNNRSPIFSRTRGSRSTLRFQAPLVRETAAAAVRGEQIEIAVVHRAPYGDRVWNAVDGIGLQVYLAEAIGEAPVGDGLSDQIPASHNPGRPSRGSNPKSLSESSAITRARTSAIPVVFKILFMTKSPSGNGPHHSDLTGIARLVLMGDNVVTYSRNQQGGSWHVTTDGELG